MASLYDRLAARPEGARALAAARLRQEVLALLDEALDTCGLTQTEIAKRLGNRKSATNQVLRGDGNVRINTLAEHLHAMGCELELRLVPAGEPRRAELAAHAASSSQAHSASGVAKTFIMGNVAVASPHVGQSHCPEREFLIEAANRFNVSMVHNHRHPSAVSASTSTYEKQKQAS